MVALVAFFTIYFGFLCKKLPEKFVPEQYETEAWGMSHFFDGVQHEHYTQLRKALYDLLGRRGYFRYNSGERTLGEKQQQQIASIFKRFGYDNPPAFDHYVKVLQLPF